MRNRASFLLVLLVSGGMLLAGCQRVGKMGQPPPEERTPLESEGVLDHTIDYGGTGVPPPQDFEEHPPGTFPPDEEMEPDEQREAEREGL